MHACLMGNQAEQQLAVMLFRALVHAAHQASHLLVVELLHGMARGPKGYCTAEATEAAGTWLQHAADSDDWRSASRRQLAVRV